METPTLEDRVDRLEQMLDKLVAYARLSKTGRLILAKLGFDDA